MNAIELVTKALHRDSAYASDSHYDDPKEIAEMASTLSLGLITLTEERLRGIIVQAYHDGFNVGRWSDDMESYPYASRIIEALKKEGSDVR